jgi:hypothetical protein
MDTSANGLVSRLAAWAAAPITQPMDIVDVILTAAFVTTIVVAWLFVLRHIIPEGE